MPMQRRAVLATLGTLLGAPSLAQPGPAAGPVQLVIGFPAGGPPDLVARQLAQRLATQLAVPVVAENRPGASGTIAGTAVSRAEADGRTLLFGTAANLAVALATMKPPPYDPVQAFTPVAEVARGRLVVLVREDAPATTWESFTRWAKSKPGQLNYASPGSGSVHHIATEMLMQQAGLQLVHVPYRSSLYQPLLAGDVQFLLESLPGPLPHLASGRLRALAVTGPDRLRRLPLVPTLAESGVADSDIRSWWGIVGPAGMSPALAGRLNAAVHRALADPEIAATLADWGIDPSPGTPAQFGDLIRSENVRWKAQVARLNIRAE